MARIIGVEIPDAKKLGISLRYIYGIGPTTASEVCAKAKVDPNVRAVQTNIKRKMSINCYQGTRHKKGLPVHGQRTSTNARTRKGPRKTVGVQRAKETKAAPAKA